MERMATSLRPRTEPHTVSWLSDPNSTTAGTLVEPLDPTEEPETYASFTVKVRYYSWNVMCTSIWGIGELNVQ